MSTELETALEAEVIAQDLMRLAERLRGRIAQAANANPASEPCIRQPRKRRGAGDSHVELARQIYRMRRRRAAYWPEELFGEPVWDIMLDLYVRAYEGRDVSVTSACLASGVPQTTALRWVTLLEERGLVERHDAKHDLRVHYLRLTLDGARRIQHFLRDAGSCQPDEPEAFLLCPK